MHALFSKNRPSLYLVLMTVEYNKYICLQIPRKNTPHERGGEGREKKKKKEKKENARQ